MLRSRLWRSISITITGFSYIVAFEVILPHQFAFRRAATPKHLWHQAVIEDFIDTLQEDREPIVSGKMALASQQLIDAIETSSRDGVAVEIFG